jgi:hypothetical protein
MLPKGIIAQDPAHIHEYAPDVARSFAGTEGFEQSRRHRKRIKMRFAHLKRILKLGRLRLRSHEVLKTNLFWPPLLRTCGESQRWLRDRHLLRLFVSVT